MANIIRSWKMKDSVESDIIKILEENAITDDNFSELTPDLIKEMIPKIGLRMEFLKKWKAVFKTELDVTDSSADTSETSDSLLSQISSEDVASLSSQKTCTRKQTFALRTQSINIKEILYTNVQGKAIVKSYKRSQSLTRQSRNLIVDIILTELLNEGTNLKNDDFQYIAEEIVKLFPTEVTTTYYIPPISKRVSRIGKSIISRGKLVDKYRNKIRILKHINEWKLPVDDLHDHRTESSDSFDEAALDAKAWLQSHSMPWEIVVTKWKLTAEYRRKNIKSNRDLKLCQIFESWPILKHPNAYTLIEENYSSLELSTQELTLESWKTFFAKILAVRPPKKDDDCAKALIELLENDQQLTDDVEIVLQLRLLPHLFPPKNRIRLKKNQWKPSIPECKDSIIILTTLIADITKIQEEKKRKAAADIGITLQPFIMAVGPSNADISDIFISVDNILYKVSSALKAVDLNFKIFQVFDIEYPIESVHIWLLIQRVLYGYENSLDKITPNVMETISDIMTFQDKNT
ncbi:uncharacterized protein LOC105204400 [Solenopsis invicta]|uniref:uncharacterized protein LOC105204400 n=1 Tax=Solenopsis invicta TaxID=13686 RepID=UPI00193D0385|nr:uncharacterized protein LOC105204400 [Solenopsis invicta]